MHYKKQHSKPIMDAKGGKPMRIKKKKASNKLVNANRVDGWMDGREYGQINE